MPETQSLKLPLLIAEQAQKHVTHNEALRLLDAIVQLSVIDRDLTAPPGTPSDGDRYIIAAGSTGVWTGHAGDIAVYQDGAWDFREPGEGWRCWVEDESAFLIFNGGSWVDWGTALGVLQNLSLLGVGTTADATNPFSAKLNNALLTAKYTSEGGDGDLGCTLNKEADADSVSILFQRAFSGRAEFGLIGDNDLIFKVSPDGSSWTEALRIDKDDGSLQTSAGTNSAPALRVSASEGFYDHGSGIGTNANLLAELPGGSGGLIALRTEGAAQICSERHSSDNVAPEFVLLKSRNTISSPQAVVQNDELGRLVAMGYASSANRTAFLLVVTVTAASPSSSDMQSRMTAWLPPAGSGSVSEIFRLEHATGMSMFGANVVIDQNRHLRLRSYTVATVPSASPAGQLIYVSNGTSNKRLAVSDGSNWRWPDGVAVT
jgi:hypothetical protein